jgi:hypothetical protein
VSESTGTATPDVTEFPPSVRRKSSGAALPSLSVITSLINVIVVGWSSFVIVHVRFCPSVAVIVPPIAAGHSEKPVIDLNF